MDYTINKGIVECDGTPVEPEILFKLGRIQVSDDVNHGMLVVSKRPADLRIKYQFEPQSTFQVYFKEVLLEQSQIDSILEFGYFLADSKRVHFVDANVRAHLNTAFSNISLPKLIKLLRNLYNEGYSDDVPSGLINQLRSKVAQKPNLGKLFEQTLYPYQEEGVNWLSFCVENGVGTILADDMGLGKTAQVIALCCDVLEKSPRSRILVVVPNPLIDNWIREFSFFAPNIVPYLHYGPDRRGVSSPLLEHSVIITPYTTMHSDISMLEEIPFDLALFDEASLLKNPSSGRSISARRLDVGVSVAMSGTPVENSLIDAWALGDLVFPGYLGSEESFKSRYVDKSLSETLNKDLNELESSLRQITLRRMKSDVLDQLPEKLDIHVAVTQSENEKSTYESIIEEMKEHAENGGGGILPLINKLQQFTAHPALIDNSIRDDLTSIISSSAKFELMMHRLDAISQSKEKVLIFATFQRAIDLIQKAIEDKYGIRAGIIDGRTPNAERQPLIDEFSSSAGFDVLILHPKTAGMGLNITAATHVIHYCRQWNPALEAQATARAWRNGQQSVVNVYYYFYADTIEETIDERIRLKQQLSEQVVSVADYKETDMQIMLDYLQTRKL